MSNVPKEYVLVIERTAPAASSKDVSHTTSPSEVESSVEIGTNSPVPVRFLCWCNLQSYIFFGVQGSVGKEEEKYACPPVFIRSKQRIYIS